jgi:D-xylose transport system substrate-binding protein
MRWSIARGVGIIASILLATAIGCGGGTAPRRNTQSDTLKVGFLMDTVAHERWRRDRDLFIARAKENGAETIVEVAEGDAAKQLAQAQSVLEKGVKVLVVVPHDAQRAGAIVEAAKSRNVPVVSYDRLIWDADIDLYVSFDNVRVGEMQAQYLASRAPKGNYVLIGGAPTDHNAQQLREGQTKALKPLVDRRAIHIVSSEWATDWSAAEARRLTEDALKKTKNQIVAVVASNDVTAGGAIEALAAANLAGKVLVSGQDAELDAARRIVQGTQAMTVYKPVRSLARLAAAAAVALAKGQDVPTATTVNNGRRDVPAMLLPPISVDKETIDSTLIRDGFHTREAVYDNSRRP